ncbi:ubiquitin-related domain-containing protein [Corynascus similis CBS 632.67]
MAEPASKTGDTEPVSQDTNVPQPSDPLPANEADEGKEQTNSKETVTEPVAESSAAAAGAATADADESTKGKEKNEPSPAPAEKPREGDSLSIKPSDIPQPAVTPSHPDAPVCAITLLLPTGARHPYKIDEKYLSKRNVDVPDLTESGARDPFSISVYKLKELILREWREEWEGKPASPSSIRLIHFGKLLDDKEQLKKYQFSQDSPNVVHMSVRPPEMMEEEEATNSKASGREGRTRDGGSGCCVIL